MKPILLAPTAPATMVARSTTPGRNLAPEPLEKLRVRFAVTSGDTAVARRVAAELRVAGAAQRERSAAASASARKIAELTEAPRAAAADRRGLADRDARIDRSEQLLQVLKARRVQRGMAVAWPAR